MGARGGRAAGGTSPEACLAPSHPSPPHPALAQPPPATATPRRAAAPRSQGPAPHPRLGSPLPALRSGPHLTPSRPGRLPAPQRSLPGRGARPSPQEGPEGSRWAQRTSAAASPAPRPRPPHTESDPRMRAGHPPLRDTPAPRRPLPAARVPRGPPRTRQRRARPRPLTSAAGRGSRRRPGCSAPRDGGPARPPSESVPGASSWASCPRRRAGQRLGLPPERGQGAAGFAAGDLLRDRRRVNFPSALARLINESAAPHAAINRPGQLKWFTAC